MSGSSGFADTPEPPYVAVIFTSLKRMDDAGYGETAAQMSALVRNHPGFLGMESTRDSEGFGVTISYWRDQTAVTGWRSNPEHREARRLGKTNWYRAYRVRICEVKREYAYDEDRGND